MRYGICHLNCVPIRKKNTEHCELVTQLLFGDHFQVLEKGKKWSRIRVGFDFYEGWLDNKQYLEISEKDYKTYLDLPDNYLVDLVDYAVDKKNILIPLSMGANLKAAPLLQWTCEGETCSSKLQKPQLVKLATNYLNAPYLWGGKTPFGIDCSGFTQMVYKIGGHHLFRDAFQQAQQGEALSFIEESDPGDLAFFDNEEGKITHVGIIMKNNHIIHAHGRVRIDRLDHTGIFNPQMNSYSHQLRVIKKII